MDNIYNNAPSQELDNAFGTQAQASVQEPGQPQTQGQPFEAPIRGQPSEAPEAPANVSGQPEAQTQAPQEGQPEITEEKIANIRNKFQGDRNKLIEGIVNIGQKLGKQVDMAKVQVMSEDELIREYALAKQELGSGSQQSQTDVNAKLQELERQNQMLLQFISQIQTGFTPGMPQGYPQGYPQQTQPQGPARDPQTGRFISQQAQGQEASDFDIDLDDFDYDKMIEDENYVKDYMKNQLTKAMSKIQEHYQNQLQAERQRQAQIEMTRRMSAEFEQRVNNLREKVGDEEFQKYRQLAGVIMRNNPNLAMMRGGIDPITGQQLMDGFEMAFNMAKAMMGGYNAQQQSQQQQAQQNQLYKQVAGMPQGTARTPGQPQDPNAVGLAQAFGINLQQ